jgi:hypothetical protein
MRSQGAREGEAFFLVARSPRDHRRRAARRAAAAAQVVKNPPTAPFALLAARSPNCTFEERALAAEAINASALIVYNSLEGIYRNRSFGENKVDFECSNGKSWESVRATRFEGYPKSQCAKDDACASGKCVLTGTSKPTSKGGTEYEICCAWDLYMTMAGDYETPVSIPAAFVTMGDADALKKNGALLQGARTAALFMRPLPWMNISSVLLWALGVATCAYASWRSADEERRKLARAAEARKPPAAAALGGDARDHSALGLAEGDAVIATPVHQRAAAPAAPAARAAAYDDDDDDEAPPALELTTHHAFGFIVVASTALLVLFFVDLYALSPALPRASRSLSLSRILGI